jgi:hypothetical protein
VRNDLALPYRKFVLVLAHFVLESTDLITVARQPY